MIFKLKKKSMILKWVLFDDFHSMLLQDLYNIRILLYFFMSDFDKIVSYLLSNRKIKHESVVLLIIYWDAF